MKRLSSLVQSTLHNSSGGLSVDLKESQAANAERIAEQFLLVRKQLEHRVEEADLNGIAATLTAALWSSDEGAKANGLTKGKLIYLAPPRG
ncbi:hypothetical protein ABIB42_000929 [Massilia sp. UYP32]|uniref:hypothetical protein n=1 Tax=Massilia TaxID=149698 RepID=UPI0012FBABAC|nr:MULTISPECIES: hypothetical protein [Massilia]QYG03598.1 hypothetical protein KY496_09585 [Massilia sp. NP310]